MPALRTPNFHETHGNLTPTQSTNDKLVLTIKVSKSLVAFEQLPKACDSITQLLPTKLARFKIARRGKSHALKNTFNDLS